jgi:hypothetical protein
MRARKSDDKSAAPYGADILPPALMPPSRPSVRSRRVVLAIFIVASALRLGLAFVNREANDDHMAAIRIIAAQKRLPAKADCWECFQPKLFHATAAAVIQLPGLRTADRQIVAVQLLNAAIGCATLLLAWWLLRASDISDSARVFGFGLTALNPELIGINGQATNDTFAIFFGAVAVYFALRFAQQLRVGDFVVMTVATALGIVSKTNGVITFAAIALALTLFAVTAGGRNRSVLRSYAVAFVLGVVLLEILNPLGQAVQNWRREGSPFALNIEAAPSPRLIEQTFTDLPGVRSIADAFLTFRFVDLLTTPYIASYTSTGYPEHRTSLWSQLYGRAHAIHFSAHPPSWLARRPGVLNLARAIFVLALLPTALMVIGVVLGSAKSVTAIMRGEAPPPSLVLTIVVAAFTGFIIAYAYRYRMFVVMKAVFLYPALLAFPYFFASGFDRVRAMTAPRRLPRIAIESALAALLLLYVADVASLIVQLALYR